MKQQISPVIVCAAAIFLFICLAGVVLTEFLPSVFAKEKDPCCQCSFYNNSLHATGRGMKNMYEAEDGFMQITKMPYDDLGCKQCHASSCDQCHAKEEGNEMGFSVARAKQKELCLGCHTRAGKAIAMDEEAGIIDVHFSAGLVCTDCHDGRDVHGDGRIYNSQRDPNAVKAECENCHAAGESANREHITHYENIDCTACHVTNTIACYNCHFDNFLKEKTRKGNFIAGKDWLLLVNYEGKVTAGNAQTFVYKGKKFVDYVPYYTHSISPASEARKCADCHHTEAAVKMARGESVLMTEFINGELTSFRGVVPLVDGQIKWTYLDKEDGKWVAMPGTDEDLHQYGLGAKPLTEVQVKKLSMPFR